MKVYFIKVSLRGVSPMVYRRLRVPGVTSLAKLHECIQIVNGWDDFYLHQFRIFGKDYGIHYAGGICFNDDAHKICMDDFEFDVGDKFTYEYNFFQHIMHDIRIEKIKDVLRKETNIVCLSGSGMPGVTKHDVTTVELEILQTIVDKKGALTHEDILDFQEKITQVQFLKKHINAALMTLSNE